MTARLGPRAPPRMDAPERADEILSQPGERNLEGATTANQYVIVPGAQASWIRKPHDLA